MIADSRLGCLHAMNPFVGFPKTKSFWRECRSRRMAALDAQPPFCGWPGRPGPQ